MKKNPNPSNKPAPHRQNAPGGFYSVNQGCMTCAAPHVAAPELMGWHKGQEGSGETMHCIFARQPQTSEEIDRALLAMNYCCIDNIRYGGTDEVIIGKLKRLGYQHLCDGLNQ